MLAMNDNSTSGLRHLKKKHKIDKYGQRMGTKQSTITAAFAAATTVANLVTGFKASIFRYLFVRWIVSMHVALSRLAEEIIEASECLKNWWERGLIQQLEEEEAI